MTGGTMNFITTGPVAQGTPTIATTAAGSVATSTVTMRGHVNPNGLPTTYWFEYGTDPLLVSILGGSAHTALPGNGTTTVSVSADVKMLTPNVKYYYRLIARNTYGTIEGTIVAFTTAKK